MKATPSSNAALKERELMRTEKLRREKERSMH
jgi:hypothetical protein